MSMHQRIIFSHLADLDWFRISGRTVPLWINAECSFTGRAIYGE